MNARNRTLLALAIVGFVVPNTMIGLFAVRHGLTFDGYFRHWGESLPATRAAYVTSQGPGFRMAMTISGYIGGEPFSLSTSGAFDEHERRAALSETVSGKTVPMILDLPYGYVHSTGKLIKGKPWARFRH